MAMRGTLWSTVIDCSKDQYRAEKAQQTNFKKIASKWLRVKGLIGGGVSGLLRYLSRIYFPFPYQAVLHQKILYNFQ